MRKLLIIILVFCALLPMVATDRLADINAVKKSPDFLYAEATMKTANEASEVARDLLRDEIIRWTTEELQKPMDSIQAQRISEKADTMITSRADMIRVFAFIDKKELDASAPIPAADSTLLTDSTRQLILQRFAPKRKVTKHGDVITKIMSARNFFELKDVMEPLKEKGEITGYGKYATAKDPAICYLVVYDPAGNLVAWLGKGENIRKNLKTGKNDSEKNYRGCGAIWFTIKEQQ